MVTTTACKVMFRPASEALRFLPEGPYTNPAGGISWVGIQHGGDSKTGSINLFDTATNTNQTFDLPGRPGFAFPTSKPGVFVAGVERALGLFDTNDSTWTELVGGVEAEVSGTIINDAVAYQDNLIFGCKDLKFEDKKAGLYLYRGSDSQLIQLRNDQVCSNGKAVITENGQLMLIDIDTPTKTVTKAAINIEACTLGEPQVIVDVTAGEIFPDGLIVTPDAKSVIIAFYDPADPEFGVARQYGIESGEIEAIWTCPGSPRVTCPQLVDIGGKICLVLTTAVEGMEAEQLAKHPNAGCLFVGETSFETVCDQPVFPIS